MEKLLRQCGFLFGRVCRHACGALCMGILILTVTTARAEVPKSINECAKIEDNAKRIQCYDELAGRKAAPSESTSPAPSIAKPDAKATPGEPASAALPAAKSDAPTYLERLWELDKESRKGKFSISPHRTNYILPYTYVEKPNEKPIREDDPRRDLKNAEVALQISFKAKLWQDILGKNMDLWFAYTQRSFWQLYNFADSSPFRETNYEPEILLNFRTDYDLIWLKNRFINIGFNHQSNGQTEPLSRSWNRVVANFGFERDNLALILKTWLRVKENEKYDDNPNIEHYLGYGELWAYYFWKGNRFGLMLRDNFHINTNRGAIQLEWAFPLFERVGGYIQYFNGYGESMLDYNHHVNRIGVGFVIKDWD